MFGVAWIEWLGYLGSALIVLSLVMRSVVNIRIVNTLGCLIYVVYSLIIGAYPVFITNFLIIIVNLYHLYQLKQEK